jgi:hypothetical protein
MLILCLYAVYGTSAPVRSQGSVSCLLAVCCVLLCDRPQSARPCQKNPSAMILTNLCDITVHALLMFLGHSNRSRCRLYCKAQCHSMLGAYVNAAVYLMPQEESYRNAQCSHSTPGLRSNFQKPRLDTGFLSSTSNLTSSNPSAL